jgi:hypothetical protein
MVSKSYAYKYLSFQLPLPGGGCAQNWNVNSLKYYQLSVGYTSDTRLSTLASLSGNNLNKREYE